MTTLVWLQREFRLHYAPALQAALNLPGRVIFAYFDDAKHRIGEANSAWLAQALIQLQQDIRQQDGELWMVEGDFKTELTRLIQTYSIERVFYSFQVGNPFASQQQTALAVCKSLQIKLEPFFSEFWLAPKQITNQKNCPYLVFTPFYKTLMQKQALLEPLDESVGDLSKTALIDVPECYRRLPKSLLEIRHQPWAESMLSSWQIGETPAWQILGDFIDQKLIDYIDHRDLPAQAATSGLSPYLHFGHLPSRQVYFVLQSEREKSASASGNLTEKDTAVAAWLRQLIWKEFARHLLFWFPQTQNHPFQVKYQAMPWHQSTALDKASQRHLKAWQQGKTGIPIIDAGLRELWQTGTMHNRVRMLVASFLTKNLNQSWRSGLDWFADTLVDADPANNIMGWQWVAGCGVDAAPYYRLFNPVLQSQKFDADGEYLRRWLPELSALPAKIIHTPWLFENECRQYGVVLETTYPKPIVDLAHSRQAHLARVEQLKHASL